MSEWLSTYGAENKIVDGEVQVVQQYYPIEITAPPYRREVVTSEYRYVGMTLAGAQACRDAINDPANDIIAQVRRTGNCGPYEVAVVETTATDWEEITP